jgi:AraC-like DNA-binding protein
VFNQSANEIMLSRTCLDSPILFANARLLEGLEQLVRKSLHQVYAQKTWTEKVAHYLFGAIMEEKKTDIVSGARQFAVTERNLQLKLKAEGTSYRRLLEDVRKEIALKLLQDDDASICEVALLLGFADQSAFQHAFKRWTGKTPGLFRK